MIHKKQNAMNIVTTYGLFTMFLMKNKFVYAEKMNMNVHQKH